MSKKNSSGFKVVDGALHIVEGSVCRLDGLTQTFVVVKSYGGSCKFRQLPDALTPWVHPASFHLAATSDVASAVAPDWKD